MWDTVTANLDELWFGLANWENGRWDWFNAPAAPWLEFDSLEKYFSEEDSLFITFVTTSNLSAGLGSLRVGLDPGLVFHNLEVSGQPGDYCLEVEFTIESGPAPYDAQLELTYAHPDLPVGAGGRYFYTFDGSPYMCNGIHLDTASHINAPIGYLLGPRSCHRHGWSW